MNILKSATIILLILFIASGCGGSGNGSGDGNGPSSFNESWADNLDEVFSALLQDDIGDQSQLVNASDSPAYYVSYPPVDITMISLGIQGDYLYARVDLNGTIPEERFHIAPDSIIEEQWVTGQGMNFSLDLDRGGDPHSVGDGTAAADIYFSITVDYASGIQAYGNYQPNNNERFEGELGKGGAGENYVVARYNIANLGLANALQGQTVLVYANAEAESSNADGSLMYHHFAFDFFDSVEWIIPTPSN